MLHIYVALIEVKPLAGCFLDPSEINGAIVRCYIPATNQGEARLLLNSTLAKEKLELFREEWFVRNDKVEWENPDDESGIACVNEALETEEIVFSEFNAWGHDAPDAI